MKTLQFGENAGRVWEWLDTYGPITISQLMSRLEMSESELFGALGWLAREGKISYTEHDGEALISNKPDPQFYCFG